MNFEDMLAGSPMIALTMALTTFASRWVSGKQQLAAAMIIGLILGIAYQMSIQIPADFSGWFGAAIYGLGLGLTASGVYESLKPKITVQVEQDQDEPPA